MAGSGARLIAVLSSGRHNNHGSFERSRILSEAAHDPLADPPSSWRSLTDTDPPALTQVNKGNLLLPKMDGMAVLTIR